MIVKGEGLFFFFFVEKRGKDLCLLNNKVEKISWDFPVGFRMDGEGRDGGGRGRRGGGDGGWRGWPSIAEDCLRGNFL